VEFVFHKFIWNRHGCHSFICIVWTSMSCALFKHECYMLIHIVYTRKSCTWLLRLNNAWHSCVNDMNPWNNRFHMDLKWTHEAYKFVMVLMQVSYLSKLFKMFKKWKTWTLCHCLCQNKIKHTCYFLTLRNTFLNVFSLLTMPCVHRQILVVVTTLITWWI
jgi:hypothetical protein